MGGTATSGMLQGIIGLAQTYYGVVLAIAPLIGLFLVGSGIRRFASSGNNGSPFGLAATEVFVGMLFINLPTWLNDLSQSLLQRGVADSPLNYHVGGDSGLGASLTTAITIIEAVGLWGVVRGLWLMRESVQDRKAFWTAMTHTIFGCCALNFPTFVGLLNLGVGGALTSSLNVLGLPTG